MVDIFEERLREVKEDWRGRRLDLVNRSPFSFDEAKATCVIGSLSGAG